MGRQSKAIQACLKNLQKHVMTPQKAYVEDVTDEEDADYNHAKQHGTADLLEEGFFFLDEDSDSDEDSEYGEEDIDEEESARFINAYSQGLSGPEAAWANRKYHGHRCLPPDILADLKKEFEKKYGGDK